MRYLSKYENWFFKKLVPKYKVDDFVEIEFDIDLFKINKLNIGKILSIEKDRFDRDNFNYEVEIRSNILKGGKSTLQVLENRITRKLTPEEVEEFLINLEAQKYNL